MKAHAPMRLSAIFGRKQILIRELYQAVERDYQINEKKSVRNIEAAWSLHLEATFGGMDAEKLSTDDVENYVLARQKEGATNGTINRELSVLKRMYTLGMRARKISARPYIPTLKERNVRKGFLRDDQYDALARETANVGLWLRSMFECAYVYGFRKSELLEMRVSQLDFTARKIVLEAGETKNDEGRSVNMSPKVLELLRECAAGKKASQLVFTRMKDASGRNSKIGGRIADFRDSWNTACTNAGVPGLLFHDLRRSAVINMVTDGLDEKRAMMISGHKTRSVFDRYHIVSPEALQDAAQKMERGARERLRKAIVQAKLFEDRDAAELESQLQPTSSRKPS